MWCHRNQRELCFKKGKSVSVLKFRILRLLKGETGTNSNRLGGVKAARPPCLSNFPLGTEPPSSVFSSPSPEPDPSGPHHSAKSANLSFLPVDPYFIPTSLFSVSMALSTNLNPPPCWRWESNTVRTHTHAFEDGNFTSYRDVILSIK